MNKYFEAEAGEADRGFDNQKSASSFFWIRY